MKKVLLFSVLCLFVILLSSCEKANNEIPLSTDNNYTSTSSSAEKEPESEKLPLDGRKICIDAGHGINSYNKYEPIAPGSTETKIAFASGTAGKNLTEEQLNLIVSLKLEKRLKELGATIYMTRTSSNCDMTNVDRAEFANNNEADLSIKIHADGNNNSSVHGVSMLIPSDKYIKDSNILSESKKAGSYILDEVILMTEALNRGLVERSDLTGFNWSQVPIVLLEMGFMTNPEENALLETEAYQDKIVNGISNGVCKYFETE